ncbi:MAG: AMP-binding protein [Opitutaceae bacterium]
MPTRQAIGEIVVAGDHVLKGYLGGHGDAETKFKVGDETWHRTGDAGSLDAAGHAGSTDAAVPGSTMPTAGCIPSAWSASP